MIPTEDKYDFKYAICCACKAVYDKTTQEIVDIPPEGILSHGYCPSCFEVAMAEVRALKEEVK